MTRRNKRKTDYDKFMETVAPTLGVDTDVLSRNDPYLPQALVTYFETGMTL